jgi:hypothetical protein
VSFAAIKISFASQRVILKVSVYFVIDSVRKLFDTKNKAQQKLRLNCGQVDVCVMKFLRMTGRIIESGWYRSQAIWTVR